ncbi:MAG: carboxypeptidase regulatory-like domain-containing protein [Acidobacteria bacterium]|nr:carboxypeptidase regulatory-like domain-containing protein [Acidobacteriota bacterium]
MSRTRALGLLLIASLPALAQESRGTILGRVTDSTGAVIPNAEVRAINVATQAPAAARTNESGNYAIPYLIPGAYTLTVEAAGFKKYQREGIQVRVNDTLDVNIEMTVGDVSERVEVSAAAPLLETTTSSLGQVVDKRRVTELPIQAGNAFELVLLAPGVTNATNLRLRKAAFNNAPSQITTDGNPQYSNEFTIDGVTNTFSSGTQPRVAFSPPQTAISEFKVQTTSFDASLGHTPGSVINVSTASGTNEIHGELHHWLSNSALDAPDLFQNRARQKRPVYQDNRYGFSVGGPVWLPRLYDGRNKTFFFYA